MRRFLVLLTVLFLTAATAFAHGKHGMNVSISFDDDDEGSVTDCSGLSVRFAGERVAVVSEEVPFRGSALRVRSVDNGGGIRVLGTSGNAYSIQLCKAVAPGVDAASIRAVVSGNEISVRGPENERWVGYFLIHAPRNADLNLRASNGPISVTDFHGTVDAAAVNGPVSVKDSSGTINAVTTNGPVSLAGGSGNIRLEATNGPVSVKLTEPTFAGNIDASTKNGPASIKLPRGFRSGVLAESRGHGPISCKAEGCAGLRARAWDDDDDSRPRTIELGSGPRVIRLSTVNGPLSIKEN